MKKQFKLGVIGCGAMARTILRGVVLSDLLNEKKIAVSDVSEDKFESVKELGVKTFTDNRYVAENSEFLILAVKKEHINSVLTEISSVATDKIISVVSNVTKNVIKNAFGLKVVKVARCVPNFPCSIGSGIIGIDMFDFNHNLDDTEFITNVFSCMGTILSADESKLDAIQTLNSASPILTFRFIDALVDAGEALGLSRNSAKLLAVQSVFGAAEMVGREEQTLDELIVEVCKQDGAGLSVIKNTEKSDFDAKVKEAVDAYLAKYKEL